jgi:diguanylate cyclase (GGDEF)-like protein
VIRPITQLCNDIDDVNLHDLENSFYNNTNSIFYVIYESIDHMIVKLNQSNKKVKMLNTEVNEHALKDYLTKLPNRYSIKASYNELIKEHENLAIVILDLDNFKDLNDARGHSFGDKVLVLLSKRLIEISNDRIKVSRFGGDEFMLVISFEDKKSLLVDIERIEKTYQESLNIGDETLFLDASIGIAL